MTDKLNWYAVYTKPRWEKKVTRLLSAKNIECYCPLNKVRKKWSDRVKIVEEPLFKSYVFVRIDLEEQLKVRQVEGVINFVYWQGKPARIRDEEMAIVRKFMSDYEDVSVESIEIRPYDEVMVNKGILLGKTGVVKRVLHHVAEVELQTLGFRLVARFEKKSLIQISGRII